MIGEQIPHADYSEIAAMNWSALREMATSPLAYQWRLDHPRPDTDYFLFGRAAHCAILEPDLFGERYLIAEPRQCEATTKQGKQCSKPAIAGSDRCSIHGGAPPDGIEVLTPQQGLAIERMTARLDEHPAIELLDNTLREHVVTWKINGIDRKARLDAVNPERLIEIKTTRSLAGFQRDAARLLYHGQAAWYRDGAVRADVITESAEVVFIALETQPPYDVGAYRVRAYVLEHGRSLYERLLSLWIECNRSKIWPGQCPAVRDLELPRWMMNSDDEEDW